MPKQNPGKRLRDIEEAGKKISPTDQLDTALEVAIEIARKQLSDAEKDAALRTVTNTLTGLDIHGPITPEEKRIRDILRR